MSVMRARTQLLLHHLSWNLGKIMRPTWRNVDRSFESWAYGNGLLRQIQRLEAQALLESRRDPKTGKRVIRLTEKGLRSCTGALDPEQRWARSWDHKWRMVLFDLPEIDRRQRRKLRTELLQAHFGCLQRSVWISPDSLDEAARNIKSLVVSAGSLLLIEGIPCGGETPADLVKAAWDFQRIRDAWLELDRHLAKPPDLSSNQPQRVFQQWSLREQTLVARCLRLDPLLPTKLLPSDYPGRKVWQKRRKTIDSLLKHASAVQPASRQLNVRSAI
jgi:phenylacetic acid degradation operon negative regulatory protein